jgi:hypothetical protein
MLRFSLIIFTVFICHYSFGQNQIFKDSLTKVISESVSTESSGIPGPVGSSTERISNKVILMDSLTSDLNGDGHLDYVFSIIKKGYLESRWYEIVLMNGGNVDAKYTIPINSNFFKLDLISNESNSINAILHSDGSRYVKADSVNLSFSIISNKLIENSTINCSSNDFIDLSAFKKDNELLYGFNTFYELEKKESIKVSEWFEITLLMDGCSFLNFNYQLISPKPEKIDSINLQLYCINTLDTLISKSTRKYKKILKSVKSEIMKISSSSFGLNYNRINFEVRDQYTGSLQIVPQGNKYRINLLITELKPDPEKSNSFDWQRIKQRKSI